MTILFHSSWNFHFCELIIVEKRNYSISLYNFFFLQINLWMYNFGCTLGLQLIKDERKVGGQRRKRRGRARCSALIFIAHLFDKQCRGNANPIFSLIMYIKDQKGLCLCVESGGCYCCPSLSNKKGEKVQKRFVGFSIF